MTAPMRCSIDGRAATLTLADPVRRNALGLAMFDAFDAAIDSVAAHATIRTCASDGVDSSPMILRLRGEGPAFCAGFDLAACVSDGGGTMLADFIRRLSALLRRLRRGPWITVAEVHGAALAGGCAVLAACDFVLVARDATLGYPVHRIGVSPAVNAPLLEAAMGAGEARALLLSGDLIDGDEAVRRGLAYRAVDAAQLESTADALVRSLLAKAPIALAATRAWLNHLDGSDRDDRMDRACDASTSLCGGAESEAMLRHFWESRRAE